LNTSRRCRRRLTATKERQGNQIATPKKGYFLKDGSKVPGATTVLSALSFGSSDGLLYWAGKLAKQGLDWKSERQRSADVGTFIHDTIEHFPDPLPPRPLWATNEEWDKIRGAYAEYAEWESSVSPRVIAAEINMVSEELRCGGTFDSILEIGGEVVIADVKTGSMIETAKVAAQLSAYAAMAYEVGIVKAPIRRGLILHVPKKLRPIEINAEQMDAGLALFKTARAAYAQMKEFPA
jgi:hypothetical protein